MYEGCNSGLSASKILKGYAMHRLREVVSQDTGERTENLIDGVCIVGVVLLVKGKKAVKRIEEEVSKYGSPVARASFHSGASLIELALRNYGAAKLEAGLAVGELKSFIPYESMISRR